MFASVNAFIPASFKVERYVELELSEKQLYNYVRDLNHFKSWNPWFNLENAVTELQGQIGEKGSVLMITEGNLDSRMELAYLKPTNDVRFALDLPSHQSVESLYFLIESLGFNRSSGVPDCASASTRVDFNVKTSSLRVDAIHLPPKTLSGRLEVSQAAARMTIATQHNTRSICAMLYTLIVLTTSGTAATRPSTGSAWGAAA